MWALIAGICTTSENKTCILDPSTTPGFFQVRLPSLPSVSTRKKKIEMHLCVCLLVGLAVHLCICTTLDRLIGREGKSRMAAK